MDNTTQNARSQKDSTGQTSKLREALRKDLASGIEGPLAAFFMVPSDAKMRAEVLPVVMMVVEPKLARERIAGLRRKADRLAKQGTIHIATALPAAGAIAALLSKFQHASHATTVAEVIALSVGLGYATARGIIQSMKSEFLGKAIGRIQELIGEGDQNGK